MKKNILVIMLFLLTSLGFAQNYDKFYYDYKAVGVDGKWSGKIESLGFIKMDYSTLVVHHHENGIKCIDFKLKSGNELLEDKTSYTGFNKLSAILYVDKINSGVSPTGDVKMIIWTNKDQSSVWFVFVVDGIESIFYCNKVETVIDGVVSPITELVVN